MASPGLLNINFFWKKCYDVIISAHDVTSKTLSVDSNYNVTVVMWPKFSNSSTPVREVTITSVLQGFDQKSVFFEGWSWFKLNNLGLALNRELKFYTSVAIGLKLKVRKFLWLILSFAEVTEENVVGGSTPHLPLPPTPAWIGLRKFWAFH